jgi:hypothetical protein
MSDNEKLEWALMCEALASNGDIAVGRNGSELDAIRVSAAAEVDSLASAGVPGALRSRAQMDASGLAIRGGQLLETHLRRCSIGLGASY